MPKSFRTAVYLSLSSLCLTVFLFTLGLAIVSFKTGGWFTVGVGFCFTAFLTLTVFIRYFARAHLIYAQNEQKHVVNTLTQAKDMLDTSKDMKQQIMHWQSLFAAMPDQAWLKDHQKRILYANHSFAQSIGSEPAQLPGQSLDAFLDKDHLAIMNQLDDQALLNGQVVRTTTFDEEKQLWLETTRVPIITSDGAINGLAGFSHDVTRFKQAENQASYLAKHDPLTELPNRIAFEERVNQCIQEAQGFDESFAIIFIDVDNFKVLNDSMGHEVGDQLLKDIGKRVRQTIPSTDMVARIGGDEFVILLKLDNEHQEFIPHIKAIQQSIAQPWQLEEKSFSFQASLGISLYPEHGGDCWELVRKADTALFHAKKEGKNQFCLYIEEFEGKAERRLLKDHQLRQAIDNEELRVYYQPKVNSQTGAINGMEALVRWQHPEKGLLPPGQFIPYAMQSSLVEVIDLWVMEQACKALASWQKQGLDIVPISVNLASTDINQGLVAHIEHILKKHNVPGEYLEIEITENVMVANHDDVLFVLDQIKYLGVKLSLDDFGTGYCNLSYLARLPVDTIKIDRSFVHNIHNNKQNQTIVQSIIQLAKSLDLQFLAEGVEEKLELEHLNSLDCYNIQGFLYAKPSDLQIATDLIKQKHIAGH